MIYLYLRHTVKDYALWKEGFDTHVVARQASGATGEAYVMRNIEDPNEITLLLGWSDLASATAFTQSVSLNEAMQKAGVVGSPDIRFLEAANA